MALKAETSEEVGGHPALEHFEEEAVPFGSVEFIADDWVAEMCEVDAELMLTPGDGIKLDKAEPTATPSTR